MTGDFLSRLSERALESVDVPVPAVPPIFAPGRMLAGELDTFAEDANQAPQTEVQSIGTRDDRPAQSDLRAVRATRVSVPPAVLLSPVAPVLPRGSEVGNAVATSWLENPTPPRQPRETTPILPAASPRETGGAPESGHEPVRVVERTQIRELAPIAPVTTELAPREIHVQAPSPFHAQLPQSPDAAPDDTQHVNVSIGRIEIRMTPAQDSSPRRSNPSGNPRLSLEGYLQARDGRRR